MVIILYTYVVWVFYWNLNFWALRIGILKKNRNIEQKRKQTNSVILIELKSDIDNIFAFKLDINNSILFIDGIIVCAM